MRAAPPAAARSRGELLLLLPVLAGGFILAFFKVCDPDVFWQLMAGKVMLDTGGLIRTNVFASTFPDHPWFDPEWLFQVILALAYRWGGWAGVAALKIALVSLLASVLYRACLGRRDDPPTAAFLTLVALAVIRFRLTERPQLVSLVFFTLLVAVVDRHRRSGGRQLWLLPALFALWGNIHVELVVGLLYLLGTAAGAWLQQRGAGADPGVARRLLAVALLSVPASALNPGGFEVLAYPIGSFFAMNVTAPFIELKEFMVSRPDRIPLYWLLLAATAGATWFNRSRRDWAEILPLAGLALFGARYLREVPYFVLAAAPALLRLWPEALRLRRGAAGVRAGALAALVLAGAFVWVLRFEQLMVYGWGWGVNPRYLPVAAMDFMERARLPPNIYNYYEDGGYLIYRLYPRMGVFQDSRGTSYPPGWMAGLHMRHSGSEWLDNLRRFRVNTALVQGRDAAFLFPREQWGVVFWDDRYSLVVRRSEENRAWLERWEYRHFLPQDIRGIAPGLVGATLAEVERNEAERAYPDANLLSLKGQLLAGLGRLPEAKQALGRALLLEPRMETARTWLAEVERRLPGR